LIDWPQILILTSKLVDWPQNLRLTPKSQIDPKNGRLTQKSQINPKISNWPQNNRLTPKSQINPQMIYWPQIDGNIKWWPRPWVIQNQYLKCSWIWRRYLKKLTLSYCYYYRIYGFFNFNLSIENGSIKRVDRRAL